MNKILGYQVHRANSLKSKDGEASIAIHIYTFKNRKNTLYIVNVEEFLHHVFVLKFHTKSLRNSKNKYNILTNEKDARRVIYTCIEIGNSIYKNNEKASFGFIGSPIPKEKERENELFKTKRFIVYRKFAAFFFSPDNFIHSENQDLSSYLLFNKKHLEEKSSLKDDVISMFKNHFDTNSLSIQ